MRTNRSFSILILLAMVCGVQASDLSPLFEMGKPSPHSFSSQATGYGALGEDQSHVAVYVSGQEAGRIHPGAVAEVRLGPPEGLSVSVSGQVSSILRDADPRSHQAIVSIRIPRQSLPARTYSNAFIEIRSRQALAVPSGAVVISDGQTYVYRQIKENDFEKTAVQVGEQGSDYSEIRNGLQASDTILVQGALEWAARDAAKGQD